MSDFVKFSALKGEKELFQALRRMEAAFSKEMEAALPEEAQRLMGDANAKVPLKSGTLAASATVSSSVNSKRTKFKAAAAYTDVKAPAVHEDIFWGRKSKQRQPGFKWFERALNGFTAGFRSRIVSRLKALVNRGA